MTLRVHPVHLTLTSFLFFLLSIAAAQRSVPLMTPFFYLCSYHGNQDQSTLDVGEVALSVSIEGDPETYEPERKYQVTITSSRNFDGFFLTGLYTMSTNMTKMFGLNSLPPSSSSGSQVGVQPFGHSFICSIVHSYIGHLPQQQVVFTWMAPENGTGCISFLATATLRSQVLFKDTTVLQLCEKGTPGLAQALPKLASLHEDGIVFRDDFDSTKTFSQQLWQETEGLSVGIECGVVIHKNSAVACDADGTLRQLTTVPLNLTTASVVQFALSPGSCNVSATGKEIALDFGQNGCNNWTTVEQIRVPEQGSTEIHLVHLPRAARQNDICLRWTEPANEGVADGFFDGCWAMDDVLVTNVADPPSILVESFDPIDPSNWLFFPGGKIQHKCLADSNAIFFGNDEQQTHNYMTTRDLNLDVENLKPLFEETFDYGLSTGWITDGGEPGQRCSDIHQKMSAVFYKRDKTRRLCTPPLDLRQAGSLRFKFLFGSKKCSISISPPRKSRVFVYVEDDFGHWSSLSTLDHRGFKEPSTVLVPIGPGGRGSSSRICWTQKTHGGHDWDVWAVDLIQIFSVAPSHPEMFIQFGLTMNCGSESSENSSVILEVSTNNGLNWFPLYEPCLAGKCRGTINPLSSLYRGHEFESWQRVTHPLPIHALSPKTRFRWRQLHRGASVWAIDNVYIGPCAAGCNGHGQCEINSCVCDFGYRGQHCEASQGHLPEMVMASFDSASSADGGFSVIKGGSLAYDCGVVASGKSIVFHKDGVRMLQTGDLNTTQAGFIQFSIRVGSGSDVGKCPAVTDPGEEVLLQFSCDGGVTWSILKQFSIDEYRQPGIVSLALPSEAQQSLCNFRWWQPVHSGYGFDVWALDDVSITNSIFNTICLDFSNENETSHSIDIHLGNHKAYCGRHNTLSFTGIYDEGDSRYLITNMMHIGPSYVIQFELVMNCNLLSEPSRDGALYLEFSTDHGMTWDLVDKGCWPPTTCKEYRPATVYYVSEFPDWKRVVVLLPPSTWSSSTRFRLRQEKWSASSNWALSSLYVGQQCPELCHGHGLCVNGQCLCDADYGGSTCVPTVALEKGMRTDFSMMSRLPVDWSEVIGGELVGANQGCGTILSGESLYFSKESVRRGVTKDLDTSNADFVQFYVQLGGQGGGQCFGVDRRQENLLLQYSVNGGINWHLLKELHGTDYATPRLVHVDIPEDARTASTRFRWWQPQHSGPELDQWALDEIVIARYENMKQLEDDFEQKTLNDGPEGADPLGLWLTVTDAMLAPFCGSDDNTLMFMAQPKDKFATTKDLDLSTNDVLQFRINVGCSRSFSYQQPVLLQFSHDAGRTWSLVQKPCYVDNQCVDSYTDGSIYYPGPYGQWRTVVLPLDSHVTAKRTNFRWWQKGDQSSGFAIDDVYVGTPCPEMCNGHGLCVSGTCRCYPGFEGIGCWSSETLRHGMIDRFEDSSRPSGLWERVIGGNLGQGCGVIASGNSLYFDGVGAREARTIPVDTTHIIILQFSIRIGNKENHLRCRKPVNRKEGVVVDYTTNNGISWNVLRILDPFVLSDQPQVVIIKLPPAARTNMTSFRWWQPLTEPESRPSEWAVDDVIIAFNESATHGFQEDFNSFQNDVWYMAMNAVPKITCQSKNNALEFSKNGQMRFAETWDYIVTSSTFLQFDIAMGCSGTYSTLYTIQLQYSIDMGRSWHPVIESCSPSVKDCSGYHLGNDFTSETFTNWTRVTLYLPPGAVSPATRFRWLQQTVTLRGNVWALDNIYLGEGCPWMCSGHGSCDHGVCLCDPGYIGEFCVPSIQLPMTLRDDFEEGVQSDQWAEVYGGDVSGVCDVVVSGKSLAFYKDNVRMAVTVDMDVSMALYLQFSLKYGCHNQINDWPKNHQVLIQYSSNGGILWKYLHEIHYHSNGEPKYFLVRLPTPALTNATRFRFWQPEHGGHMKSIWAIDDVHIGGSLMNPDMLYETFDLPPNHDEWPFLPGGKIGEYCAFNTRSDSLTAGIFALTFTEGEGDHYITTRDISISDMSILQFDLNVGCSSESSDLHSVRLEYSTDYGKSWRLVVPRCSSATLPPCDDQEIPSTVYYPGTTPYWQRIIIPLNGLPVCGVARFRWYQGRFRALEPSTVWALDNVYIGMQCKEHCNGHGMCVHGLFCQCDEGYEGEICAVAKLNPKFFKEDFDGVQSHQSDSWKWAIKSGGNRTEKCGNLLSGNSMHFYGKGERMLTTSDLDLSHAVAVQFYIKIGCDPSSTDDLRRVEGQPVLLRFSTDAGIHWTLLEKFEYNASQVDPRYVVIHLPLKAQRNSTRVQWWQPTIDGTHAVDWAIDQIYIGGNDNGNMVMQDALITTNNDNWLMYPGARIQSTCGLSAKALHFAGPDKARYAVTKDVTVTEFTYLQFYISMSCYDSGRCYGIELQYSLDLGKTWQLVERECLMESDIDCTVYHAKSVFTSDVYYGWTRVTIKLPYYTRSMSTRFRWIQETKFQPEDSWAITYVYIGDECDCSCGGHGRCDRGKCLCDKGWTGSSCVDPQLPLPTGMRETFTRLPNDANWVKVNGGVLSTQCGVLSSGNAMHMKGDCTRQLVTRDLDLREATFIQFYFRFGCTTSPTVKDEGVMVEYSINGGTQWTALAELYFDQYKNNSYINIELVKETKKQGVRIRWWQPVHPGQSRSDWAIDDVIIGGKAANPNELMDEFQSDGVDYSIWLQNNNLLNGDFCGTPDVIVGQDQDKETVALTTIDLAIHRGYIVQFRISVGCNASWDDDVDPVRLEFSNDYGITWRLVVEECLPFYPECNGVASPPSVYYAAKSWRRITIPLEGELISNATRFRWIQRFDTRPGHASDGGKSRQQWALDDVYIGLGCPSLCNGHGRCMYPSCFCDPGYGGATCYQTEQIRSSLFETFDDEPAAEVNWDLVQGGSVGFGCKTIVDGQGLYFTGKGQRQVVTVDLDLRLASYIKYHAMIGGPSTKIGCGAPRSRDEDIILQFSHDGGITWQLLHILDYDSYWKTPQWDYISLPPEARTNTTRVRWWQKIGADDPDRPIGWVIDDVIIAGMDINPSELFESFESGLNKAFWEFHPNGYLQEGVCGRNGMVMVWGEKAALKMITTCQLIVQDGYMMQFKISVGCDQSDNACERNQAVALEYNKDPTSDEWDLVYPQCLLSGQNTECRPYGFHQGTLYSAASHGTWTRVTIALPPKTFSSQTRFRWVQKVAPSSRGDSPSWALDDVLIAERCPDMCRGRGDCIDGTCYCDPGYVGPTCEPQRHLLLSYLTDGFEGGVQPLNWASVEGGGMGLGCGVLLPAAHGKNLYFNGCGIRQATTAEMDLTKASKLTFVLQIGSHKQTPTCNIRLDNDACNGKITLQYTRNKGIDWTLLAVHNPSDFLSPKKIAYDIPSDARAVGVQFRWWQPEHRGSGSDQWAIDHVEIKITHLDQMMRDNFFSSRFNSKEEMMKRKQLSSFSSSSIRIV